MAMQGIRETSLADNTYGLRAHGKKTAGAMEAQFEVPVLDVWNPGADEPITGATSQVENRRSVVVCYDDTMPTGKVMLLFQKAKQLIASFYISGRRDTVSGTEWQAPGLRILGLAGDADDSGGITLQTQPGAGLAVINWNQGGVTNFVAGREMMVWFDSTQEGQLVLRQLARLEMAFYKLARAG